jgi:hypothetical protein
VAVGCVACAGLRAVRIARNLGRREGILGEKGRQRSPGEYADRFHADTFARSGFEHKAEQFSHEQIWQKPERSLGRRRRPRKAWDRRITPVPHGFSADRRRAEASASRRAPAKRTGHKNRYCNDRLSLRRLAGRREASSVWIKAAEQHPHPRVTKLAKKSQASRRVALSGGERVSSEGGRCAPR